MRATSRMTAVITAISKIKPGEVDWQSVFGGCRWFHLSGITPALSESAALASCEALHTARAMGVTTSYDLNYRAKLWSPERAQAVNHEIMEYICILIRERRGF